MSVRFGKGPASGFRFTTAQAMVEFALALPIFLLVVYGLLETGRVIFLYSTVANASREAVRYASAAGINNTTDNTPHYQDCAGIRAVAKQVGFLLHLDNSQIRIYRDHSSTGDPTVTEYCQPQYTSSTESISAGDRILVEVTTQYTLIVPLVPFNSRPIPSGQTARTYMGIIDLTK